MWRGHSLRQAQGRLCPRNLTTIKEVANRVQNLPWVKVQGLKLWWNSSFSHAAGISRARVPAPHIQTPYPRALANRPPGSSHFRKIFVFQNSKIIS
jgi:hypothetical protein